MENHKREQGQEAASDDSSQSPYASVRNELDQMSEPQPLHREVSRHGSEQGLSPYASARVQLSQIKEPSMKDHFAPKPGVQSMNGDDPRIAAKKKDSKKMSQYEKDMEAKRNAIHPGGELLAEPTTPAEYAVSVALGETEDYDAYENRLAAKNAEFSPAQHATGRPSNKKQEDEEDLEELLAMKNAQMGGYNEYSQGDGFGEYSYASMNESYIMDEMMKQKMIHNDDEATRVGFDHENGPGKMKGYGNHNSTNFDEKDDFMGLPDGSKDDVFEAPQDQNPTVAVAAHGRINEPLMQYGETQVNGGTGFIDDNLAVAVAISQEEDDAFIPAAIEYDPDSKPPLYKNRRFRFYFLLAVFFLITIGVGVGVGDGDDIILLLSLFVESIYVIFTETTNWSKISMILFD
mmetsp:Transcript_29042/g.41062  ORF Transcript_29042/g.41062 Transcript_29042/m.41062 type:complete len:404 (-) Transcript_29042:234-1445(-)